MGVFRPIFCIFGGKFCDEDFLTIFLKAQNFGEMVGTAPPKFCVVEKLHVKLACVVLQYNAEHRIKHKGERRRVAATPAA